MPHFFINSDTVENNIITIFDKETYNHLVKSLRSKVGEKILLIDEKQVQYEGIITEINPNFLSVKIEKKYPSKRKLGFKLYLAQSPLRSDAQSLIIEKATEIGVEGVYPIYTDNCSVKKSVIEQKIKKWQKIMAEASKQCERAYIPTCFDLITIKELCSNNNFDKTLVFAEKNAQQHLKDYLSKNPVLKNEKVLVIIGPEGGFSEEEFIFFKQNNIETLSLGELILKAETAVIVALGNLVL